MVGDGWWMYRWLSYIITAILDGKLDSVPGIAQSVAGLGQPTPPAGPGISPDPPAQNVSQTDNPKPTSQEPEIVAVVESAPVEKGIRETVLSSHGGGNIWFSVKTLCRGRGDIPNISRCWRWESPCRSDLSVLTSYTELMVVFRQWRTRWRWRGWMSPCWTTLTNQYRGGRTEPRLSALRGRNQIDGSNLLEDK